MTVRLHGLSTAVPPHVLPQSLVEDRARAILGPRFPGFEKLLPTFRASGIETRHSVVPLDWFERPHGWADRNGAYLEAATDLFVEVAERALAAAGWSADQVDCVVTVSSTGVATPTLEALAFGRMGFRQDLIRVPVFGLGCAGGVSGLGIAQGLAAARPGSRVLLVVVEACTLAFRAERLRKADIIATVLFGDGAAAACLSTRQGGRVGLGEGQQHLWPDTLGIMGWDVADDGLGVIFDRAIPPFAEAHFGAAAATARARAGLDGDAGYICHPGGAKVILALEAALGLREGTLEPERQILRDFGNMSAPTVLFVLEAALRDGRRGAALLCALGPGFTAAFLPVLIGGDEHA